ncbi:MAG: hypothetical protein HUU22_17035 [Phycisphaerae bacterium]|nr:hypothetical protein [Phycisphaerae bacterium]NUQ47727.1 hypothetical protein [Phycisphaerae bacterium]
MFREFDVGIQRPNQAVFDDAGDCQRPTAASSQVGFDRFRPGIRGDVEWRPVWFRRNTFVLGASLWTSLVIGR